MAPKTLLFDTWGTLVDNYRGPAQALEPYVFESHTAMQIAIDWRFQQKWAMFYVTLAEAFVPHPGLTEAALRWALEKHHVELSEDAIADVMSRYHELNAYPEVLEALRAFKEQGLTLKIVANPTKAMIEAHSRFAGTFEYIDEIISSGEEAHAFKPSPKVFQLGSSARAVRRRTSCGSRATSGRRWARASRDCEPRGSTALATPRCASGWSRPTPPAT